MHLLIGWRATIYEERGNHIRIIRILTRQGIPKMAPSPKLIIAQITDDAEEKGTEVLNRVDSFKVHVESEECVLDDVILRGALPNQSPDKASNRHF
jgi:hypothetical protein